MDTEEVRQAWETIHSGQGEAFHTNVIDHGLTWHQPLYYIPLELWDELSSERNHPSCDQEQQCAGKTVDSFNEVLHAAWYWSVYLCYFIFYFLLFWGLGYASDRGSSPKSNLYEDNEIV